MKKLAHFDKSITLITLKIQAFMAIGYLRGTRKVKVKVKFNLEQATKAQRGSRYIALLFL